MTDGTLLVEDVVDDGWKTIVRYAVFTSQCE